MDTMKEKTNIYQHVVENDNVKTELNMLIHKKDRNGKIKAC